MILTTASTVAKQPKMIVKSSSDMSAMVCIDLIEDEASVRHHGTASYQHRFSGIATCNV
jgi:hypothetical protein